MIINFLSFAGFMSEALDFILSLLIGACIFTQGADNIMSLAFGVVSLVAMTPLITIQLLGFRSIISKKVREKIAMRRILVEDDDQIIEFM